MKLLYFLLIYAKFYVFLFIEENHYYIFRLGWHGMLPYSQIASHCHWKNSTKHSATVSKTSTLYHSTLYVVLLLHFLRFIILWNCLLIFADTHCASDKSLTKGNLIDPRTEENLQTYQIWRAITICGCVYIDTSYSHPAQQGVGVLILFLAVHLYQWGCSALASSKMKVKTEMPKMTWVSPCPRQLHSFILWKSNSNLAMKMKFLAEVKFYFV